MSEGIVEKVARMLYWPNEEQTRQGLAQYRAEFHEKVGQIRSLVDDLEALADRYPQVEEVVVPENIEALKPGAYIEVFVDSDVTITSPSSTPTNPLLALCTYTHDPVREIRELLDDWVEAVDDVEEDTRARVLKVLGTTPRSILDAIMEHLESEERPEYQTACD